MCFGLATGSVLTTERWCRSTFDPSHRSFFNYIDLDKATRLIAGSLISLAIRLYFPSRSSQSTSFSILAFSSSQSGGDEGTRTPDIRLAKAALSQLSYIPWFWQGCGPDWIRTSDPCVISTVL